MAGQRKQDQWTAGLLVPARMVGAAQEHLSAAEDYTRPVEEVGQTAAQGQVSAHMAGTVRGLLCAAGGYKGLAEGPDLAVGLERVSVRRATAGRVVHSPRDAVAEHTELVEVADQPPAPEEADSSCTGVGSTLCLPEAIRLEPTRLNNLQRQGRISDRHCQVKKQNTMPRLLKKEFTDKYAASLIVGGLDRSTHFSWNR